MQPLRRKQQGCDDLEIEACIWINGSVMVVVVEILWRLWWLEVNCGGGLGWLWRLEELVRVVLGGGESLLWWRKWWREVVMVEEKVVT
jgi:hypothetical protein